ncbi:Protein DETOXIFICATION 48 [Dionaea muscipula]
MCNPKPSSPTCLISPINKKVAQYLTAHRVTMDSPHACTSDDYDGLHRWPTPKEAMEEVKAIGKISGPTAVTGLLLYSRAMISMLFLGYLGELELAGGSLSIGFANITGYSVISGLAMGMEPICGQAYGAKQMKLLGLTLQRTVLLLLSASIPISFLWLNMKGILMWCGQDEAISSAAHVFIVFSIPDLFFLSVLHPLRIYLRTQSITWPLTCCTAVSVLFHVPLNFLLVVHLKMGIAGVAVAMVLTNLNLCVLLSSFIYFSGVYRDSWIAPSMDCLRGWSLLLGLAIPTCVSVCLEWWWYEFMILLCGLLANPTATVASMGILIQITSLVYVFPSALSMGVSTRVGNELGANRPARARISTMVSLGCAAGVGLAAMLFATLMRHRWGRLFTNDAAILELTAVAMPIVGLCELGNCPQTTGCGVLRGSARPTTGANINLGSFYLVGMPVAIFLGFVAKMGFSGLWLGLLAAQASCALLMLYSLHSTDWILQVQRARDLTTKSNSSSSSSMLPDHDSSSAPAPTSNNNNNRLMFLLGGVKECKLMPDDDDDDLQEILCIRDQDHVIMKQPLTASLETDPLLSSIPPLH